MDQGSLRLPPIPPADRARPSPPPLLPAACCLLLAPCCCRYTSRLYVGTLRSLGVRARGSAGRPPPTLPATSMAGSRGLSTGARPAAVRRPPFPLPPAAPIVTMDPCIKAAPPALNFQGLFSGLESTVVDCSGPADQPLAILRPGLVTASELSAALAAAPPGLGGAATVYAPLDEQVGHTSVQLECCANTRPTAFVLWEAAGPAADPAAGVAAEELGAKGQQLAPRAPGMKYTHYAPRFNPTQPRTGGPNPSRRPQQLLWVFDRGWLLRAPLWLVDGPVEFFSG